VTWAIKRWEFRRLNEEAVEAFRGGRYEEALGVQARAVEIVSEYRDEEPQLFAIALNNLADVHLAREDLAAAIPLLQQVLEIRRETLGEDHLDYARSLSKLGGLCKEIHDFEAAKRYMREALEIRREALPVDDPTLTDDLIDLALLYYRLGEQSAALPLAGEALERVKKGGPTHAALLNLVAGMNKHLGAYKRARELYERALGIEREFMGEEGAGIVGTLNNLAVLHDDMGDYAAAEPLYLQTLDIWGEHYGEDHPNLLVGLTNLAELYSATGRTGEALQVWERALAIVDRTMELVFSLGSESHRSAFVETTYGSLWSFLSLVLEHHSDSPEVVRWALDVILRRKAVGAEALAAQRDTVLGGQYPELRPQLSELNDLRMQIARKTLEGPGQKDTEEHHHHHHHQLEWNDRKEKLEAELARQIPEMSLARRLAVADRRAVAGALPPDSVLVEFVRIEFFDARAVPARGESRWKDARYLAFVMPAGEPDDVALVDLGAAESIDEKIAALRSAITGEGDGGPARDLGAPAEGDGNVNTPEAGTAVRAAVFDPLADFLGRRRRLLLSPDGDLSRLPFEILPLDQDRFLIDDYSVSYVSCGRDVLRFAAQSHVEPGEPLVVADPDFDLGQESADEGRTRAPRHERQSRDLDRSRVFGRLPGTRAEGEEIAPMLGVQPWLAGEALEAHLKACRSPRILHLATHGFFLADQERAAGGELRDIGALEPDSEKGGSRLTGLGIENPLLRSGLALAGANTWLKRGIPPPDAEDGILTAEDVSGLDLLATQLVVLSACETGLGEIRTGEGVFGLRRAFALAGARTLIMSLWKVPDRQTQELMADFYQRALNGQSRADALRDAQLAAKAKYGNPLYWGAFICEGNPGRLP
jgi:CHAT domain-containing protein/tetratricopeptide (TPR) repeat protein